MINALGASDLTVALFVQTTFATSTVYFWSGIGLINWNGQTWLGLGAMGSVSPIPEGTHMESRGLTLTLSGFDTTLLPLALGEFQTGTPVIVYLGLFSGGALIANPATAWSGRMDRPQIDIDGRTSSISINCESRLLNMNVAVDRRYTPDESAARLARRSWHELCERDPGNDAVLGQRADDAR